MRSGGGGLDGDAQSEGLELADKPPLLRVGITPAVEPVAAELVVGDPVAQDVPRHDEDGVADRDCGLAASRHAPRAWQRMLSGRRLDLGDVVVLDGASDPRAALAEASSTLDVEAVLDLSGEPVLGYEERMELIAVALFHGLAYIGPDGEYRSSTLRLSGNALLWEQGAVTLRLESELQLDQALRIAGSIR